MSPDPRPTTVAPRPPERPNSPGPAHPRRWLRRGSLVVLGILAAVCGAAWWLTKSNDLSRSVAGAESASTADSVAAKAHVLEWPADRLEGEPAKILLLDWLLADVAKLDRIEGYSATFRKQERIRGKLGPEQTFAMKVRHRPFSIYLRSIAPKAGREILFVEGERDNRLIFHNGDWTRHLPKLPIEPTSRIALADNRHPITDAGLANLTRRLVRYRRLDLTDPDAKTVLDRTIGPDGRPWLRSTHTHTIRKADRPFARIEVLYDPETRLPAQISGFDWPEADHSPDAPTDLAERYSYSDLVTDSPPVATDFDEANPAYGFR